jgi:hypothetical protein
VAGKRALAAIDADGDDIDSDFSKALAAIDADADDSDSDLSSSTSNSGSELRCDYKQVSDPEPSSTSSAYL